MANERNPNPGDASMDESLGGAREDSSPERVGGRSEENLRGIADDSDDEFEDAEDLDDDEEEEEDEGDPTV
jgi:hypothetical protein